MPLFITYVSYSHSGVKGLVDKPTDRSGAVKAAIEKQQAASLQHYITRQAQTTPCSFPSSLMDRMR